jgi:hypothetical protein
MYRCRRTKPDSRWSYSSRFAQKAKSRSVSSFSEPPGQRQSRVVCRSALTCRITRVIKRHKHVAQKRYSIPPGQTTIAHRSVRVDVHTNPVHHAQKLDC